MPLGFYFSPNAMNAQQYDTCIRKLEAAGAGKPAGRLYHACFGTGDKLAVFDVRDSQQSFDRFGQTLMPILQEIDVDPRMQRRTWHGEVRVAVLHTTTGTLRNGGGCRLSRFDWRTAGGAARR